MPDLELVVHLPSYVLNVKKKITSKTSLKCTSCLNYSYYSCENFSKEQYTAYNNLYSLDLGIAWYCGNCRSTATNSNATILEELSELKTTFNNRLMELEKTILNNTKNHTDKLNEISSNLNKDEIYPQLEKTIDKKFKQIENNLENQNDSIKKQMTTYADRTKVVTSKTEKAITTLSHGIETIKTKIVDEQEKKLIEEKSKNLCVFNIPETDDNNSEAEDRKKLKSIIDPKSEIQKGKIQSISRKGNKSGDKTRPIIIRFNCPKTRLEVLKLRNLVYEENGKSTNIYIHPDRTRRQQQENKLLVAELRNQRSKGENVYIRNGKIVKQIVRSCAWDDNDEEQ